MMIGHIIRQYSTSSQICVAFLALIGVEIVTSGLFWDSSAPGPRHNSGSSDVTQAASDDLDHLESVIEDRPLFDPTRKPPRPPPPAPVAQAPVAQEFTDRYAGAIVGPEDSVALFIEGAGGATAARVGDLVNGWKVVEIDPDSVVISGPSGEKHLEPTYDSNAAPSKPVHRPGKKAKVPVVQQASAPLSKPAQPRALRPGVAGGAVPPPNGRP